MKHKTYITPNLKSVDIDSESLCLGVGSPDNTTTDPTMMGKKRNRYEIEEVWEEAENDL